MRIRLRGPEGAFAVTVNSSDTVGHLVELIATKTNIQSFDLKYGYPPKPLVLHRYEQSTKLSAIDIDLDGEQLTVSPNQSTKPETQSSQPEIISQSSVSAPSPQTSGVTHPSERSAEFSGTIRSSKNPQRLKLSRPRKLDSDPPEIPVEEHGSTMVLRIMPDDNSCMFRAFGSAYFGNLDSMTELRSLVAQAIQAQPEVYSAAVLDQTPDEYCAWIQTEDAWGGGIELGILSQHFDIEISSIDVQTLRVDKFNEGQSQRCILVYSGIHYDAIALSPSDPPHKIALAPPDFDTKIFDTSDEMILQKAVELCRILRDKHYFTDTAKFSLRCNICGTELEGEKGAIEHASKTGHTDFGEDR
ncbi:MAG: ubiquitin-specific protease otu1 [Vezdaea acicularis]|nr:MAG: ubiquitin-specific protease otu1 [Vezdaea acicularis]